MTPSKTKLGFNGTWSMAVGGMVGGSIFSTLGVVVGIAGQWAWLSFLIAGLIALAAGYSYTKLAALYSEGGGALFGAASVFMAYEGFQLLTCDYEDIAAPQKTLPRALLSAILVVIVVYILVALGTVLLIGVDQVVLHKEVALAIAGQKAFGTTGLVIVTVAAAFSTGSAINATLFATARLAHTVAEDGELPASLEHKLSAGIPNRAVIVAVFGRPFLLRRIKSEPRRKQH